MAAQDMVSLKPLPPYASGLPPACIHWTNSTGSGGAFINVFSLGV